MMHVGERIVLSHGDTELRGKLLHENLTEQVIGAAVVRGGIISKIV